MNVVVKYYLFLQTNIDTAKFYNFKIEFKNGRQEKNIFVFKIK